MKEEKGLKLILPVHTVELRLVHFLQTIIYRIFSFNNLEKNTISMKLIDDWINEFEFINSYSFSYNENSLNNKILKINFGMNSVIYHFSVDINLDGNMFNCLTLRLPTSQVSENVNIFNVEFTSE